MSLRNRMTPFGEMIAVAARGRFMGNRGILHDDRQRLGRARWRHLNWVTCVLEFKGRHREVMTPGRYTELFFLDEAVALAAGHRPCAECRRRDFLEFQDKWRRGRQEPELPRAGALDRVLHQERIAARTRRQLTHRAPLPALPDGAFIDLEDGAWLVLDEALLPWRPDGYGRPKRRPATLQVTVLTPRSTVGALRAGYRPALHPSASGT